ncbi:MAG: hypothetical protein WAO83_25690 [Fuerstiella sp.]
MSAQIHWLKIAPQRKESGDRHSCGAMNREEIIREIRERYVLCRHSLDERKRRLWAAAEANRLGHGGLTLVSKALQMSPNTIKKGMQEIAKGDADSPSQADVRIRKPGGGRKPKKL